LSVLTSLRPHIIQLAFDSRIRTYHAWQNASAEMRRAKQNHERQRAGGILPNCLGHSLRVRAEVSAGPPGSVLSSSPFVSYIA